MKNWRYLWIVAGVAALVAGARYATADCGTCEGGKAAVKAGCPADCAKECCAEGKGEAKCDASKGVCPVTGAKKECGSCDKKADCADKAKAGACDKNSECAPPAETAEPAPK